MNRLLVGLIAACVLGLSITALILVVRHQRKAAALHRFMAGGPSALAREKGLDRQAGMLLGPSEMQAPLPPAGQNAAPLYTKLTLLLKQKPLHLPKYAEGMDAFHTYTPAQIAAVRQRLASRPDVMTLVHQAADRPRCVFVRQWSLGADLQFPEYQPMREATRLLKTESYLLARDGHYHEAIVNQARGFRVAEHAASDPVLLPFLVATSCDHITLSGMQSILTLAGPNRAVDAEVRNTVIAEQSRLPLRRAMAGEAGFGSTYIMAMSQSEEQKLSAASPGTSTVSTAADKQNWHGLTAAWQADYLTHMRVLVTASDLPPLPRRAAFDAADKHLKQEEQDTANPAHVLTIIVMPVFANIDENETRTQARQLLTEAAAFALEAKANSGAFPVTLPPQFGDPFTSKALGYRREGANGFVVYSVGPSGSFDGGKPGEKTPPRDSLFRYPAVPAALTPDMLK